MQNYEKTGYLNSHFKMFHLNDSKKINIDFHYHDFHKILIFLQGNVTYCIEGRNYDLQPNDIVFVNAGEVHCPIIHDASCYERIIIYISKDFLSLYQNPQNDLSLCFKSALKNQSHVLRIPSFKESKLSMITTELENAFSSCEYANELFLDTLFIEFMVHLNRASLTNKIEYISTNSSNQKIIDIIDYLNKNLTKDINIDLLADTFYISRYHLMHTFKKATGYTIGEYIKTKRLLYARDLIQNGKGITDACYACGFKNYSTFLRAYRKNFGCSPSKNS